MLCPAYPTLEGPEIAHLQRINSRSAHVGLYLTSERQLITGMSCLGTNIISRRRFLLHYLLYDLKVSQVFNNRRQRLDKRLFIICYIPPTTVADR